MAELLADDTLASLISECLAAVEVLHELLAEDSFGELGRERVKPGKNWGLWFMHNYFAICIKLIAPNYMNTLVTTALNSIIITHCASRVAMSKSVVHPLMCLQSRIRANEHISRSSLRWSRTASSSMHLRNYG